MPYGLFPGIFSTLDGYAKQLVNAAHAGSGLPPWLARATGFVKPVPVPHFTRFKRLDPASGIILRGAPDGLFLCRDSSHGITDFKTAKFTIGQEKLLGLYSAQLNGYAWIGEALDYKPVSHLSLIYTQPVTEFSVADVPQLINSTGFILPFSTIIVPVVNEANTLIPALLSRARRIIDGSLPDAARGCQDCELLAQLVKASNHSASADASGHLAGTVK
jgi:hypothetical protein